MTILVIITGFFSVCFTVSSRDPRCNSLRHYFDNFTPKLSFWFLLIKFKLLSMVLFSITWILSDVQILFIMTSLNISYVKWVYIWGHLFIYRAIWLIEISTLAIVRLQGEVGIRVNKWVSKYFYRGSANHVHGEISADYCWIVPFHF